MRGMSPSDFWSAIAGIILLTGVMLLIVRELLW